MQRSANGTLVLVLGILSWVGFGCLAGLPAWLIGNQSLKSIDRGEADASERGIVQVGRILGMINCIIVTVVVIVWILAIAGIVGLGILGANSQPR
jgi:Trk-type K+ transport system membrane component